MTTLVTGASGFVGAAVVRRLLARGEAVRVLVRATSDRRNLAGLDVEVALGDLTAPATLAAAVRGARHLYHVAADYRLWVRDPGPLYAANVEGTEALLRAAGDAGIERIVYTSSVATLGLRTDGRPADEDTPVRLDDMIGHYKRSKFLAEARVDALAAAGLPVVIVNPSTPVGPRDVKPTPTGRMILDAARGKMPAYVDTGLNVVHVDDVAEGHLLAMEHGVAGQRYILGGENLTLREILHAVARAAGRTPPRVRLPHGAVLPVAVVAEAWARLSGRGEPLATVDGVRMARKRMFFDSARAERELGYRTRPAQAAIDDAVAWFEQAGYFSRPGRRAE
ncbi:MAG: NAD-dependent epimerase/dehydratase family protein [Ectothiorhodospiraceae bacterium]|nr:NAD-dependent epimerase/dehydratase family protein [Chromatiales bacterium]MCP5155711.1 NAD-dependent epimerase/dehydratase family protein [Ectothiorhodospiraceae bacterium]